MALSGRAAQRMREATGRPASAIAAFLRAAGKEVSIRKARRWSSLMSPPMLDLPVMYSIVRALPVRARFYFWLATHINCRRSASVSCSSLPTARHSQSQLVEVHRQAGIERHPADRTRDPGTMVLPTVVVCRFVPIVSFIEAGDGDCVDHIRGVLTECARSMMHKKSSP